MLLGRSGCFSVVSCSLLAAACAGDRTALEAPAVDCLVIPFPDALRWDAPGPTLDVGPADSFPEADSAPPACPEECDDGDPCTDDLCWPDGTCYHPHNTAPCDDTLLCTTGETCLNGACLTGFPVGCDDGKPCTADWCEEGTGCLTEVLCPPGQVCAPDGLCCLPATCADLAVECGALDDGCGGTAWCGGCSGLGICTNGKCGGPPCEALLLDSYGGQAHDVVVEGDIAYVALGFGGLYLLDVSSPASPTYLGRYRTEDRAVGVDVEGKYAYVADFYSGVKIIDVSNPAQPQLAGSLDTYDIARDVAVDFPYAFVANGAGGVLSVNVMNPSHPQVLAHYTDTSPAVEKTYSARAVAVAGEYVYVAYYSGGLQVLKNLGGVLLLVGKYKESFGQARDVVVEGGLAYVSCWDEGIWLLDVSTPSAPTMLYHYWQDITADRLALEAPYLFVAGQEAGLAILDVADPLATTLVGLFPTGGGARAVFVKDDTAFVADSEAGLKVIDVGVPESAYDVGAYSPPGNSWGLAVVGTTAYVADGTAGLQVIEASTPEVLQPKGRLDTEGLVRTVHVAGGYAYLATWNFPGLFMTVDVADPLHPTPVGELWMPGLARNVFVNNGFAYVAREEELWIVNVMDVTNPQLVSKYPAAAAYHDVKVAENVAFLAADTDGIEIVDVSDKTDPGWLDEPFLWIPGCTAMALQLVSEYAVVACGAGGIAVVDVSVPDTPGIVGQLDLPGVSVDVHVFQGYAFLAAEDEGVLVADISDPSNPKPAGTFPIPGKAKAVRAVPGYALVAGKDGGLSILKVTQCMP